MFRFPSPLPPLLSQPDTDWAARFGWLSLSLSHSPLQLFVINNRECGACVLRVSYGDIMSNKIFNFFNDNFIFFFSLRLSLINIGWYTGIEY